MPNVIELIDQKKADIAGRLRTIYQLFSLLAKRDDWSPEQKTEITCNMNIVNDMMLQMAVFSRPGGASVDEKWVAISNVGATMATLYEFIDDGGVKAALGDVVRQSCESIGRLSMEIGALLREPQQRENLAPSMA